MVAFSDPGEGIYSIDTRVCMYIYIYMCVCVLFFSFISVAVILNKYAVLETPVGSCFRKYFIFINSTTQK